MRAQTGLAPSIQYGTSAKYQDINRLQFYSGDKLQRMKNGLH